MGYMNKICSRRENRRQEVAKEKRPGSGQELPTSSFPVKHDQEESLKEGLEAKGNIKRLRVKWNAEK